MFDNLFGLFFLATDSTATSGLNDIVFDLSNIGNNDGFTTAIVGYLVVFISLWFLSVFLFFLGKFLTRTQRKRLKETGHRMADAPSLSYSGEVNAAIAMALSLHLGEIHDEESGTLTINIKPRRYSPWSSKLYNLRDEPIKIHGQRK